MPSQTAAQFSLQGIDLYTNPLTNEGNFLRAINVDSYPSGGIKKRAGYETFLGTSNGSAVQSLFQWTNDTGSQSYLYAKKGNVLQYYDVTAGTGDWATCGNGTFSGTTYIGHAILENTLIVGDGIGSTRHTTNGTSFTDTTGAPIAGKFEQYQQRIYAAGTSTLFYSTTGTAIDWSGVSPSDSSSIQIPGEGSIKALTKIDDRLVTHKASGNMFSWDGDYLVDMSTNYGMSSPQSYAKTENYGFWLNREGIYGFGGNRPELVSNNIQPYIYNDDATGIVGTVFNNAPGVCFKFDYYLSVGTITDDITKVAINNAVIKYNYQKNLFHIYSFANRPTAMSFYEDSSGVEHLIFGDSVGQVYKFGGTATSDNGAPIEAICEMVIGAGAPNDFKQWYEYNAFFNPGSKAKLQIGISDTFRRDGIKQLEVGDTSDGDIHWRFPQGSRSQLLYLKVYENSGGPRFEWYGHAIDFEVSDIR